MNAPQPPSLAAKLALYTAAKNHLEARIKAIKAEVQLSMEAGEIQTLKPKAADKTLLATISYSYGKTDVVITDPKAYVDFVKAHHPTEIVEVVRPAFTDRVKDEIRKFGSYADPATGEAQTWFQWQIGNPYISVKVDPDITEAIGDAIDGGHLIIPEIEG